MTDCGLCAGYGCKAARRRVTAAKAGRAPIIDSEGNGGLEAARKDGTMDNVERAVYMLAQGCSPADCAYVADLLGVEHPYCADIDGYECEECAERVADALAGRMMPEGVQWPRFADGEPVRLGDEVLGKHGEPMAVTRVSFVEGGCYFNESHHRNGRKRGKGWRYVAGERVKRPEPTDTQERIDEDARKTACEYFGADFLGCTACDAPVRGMDCTNAMALDLLRRQRELCAKEAGR